jgi:hypothetical protein
VISISNYAVDSCDGLSPQPLGLRTVFGNEQLDYQCQLHGRIVCYLRPQSAARMILDCIMAPDDVVVHELTFRPLVETSF